MTAVKEVARMEEEATSSSGGNLAMKLMVPLSLPPSGPTPQEEPEGLWLLLPLLLMRVGHQVRSLNACLLLAYPVAAAPSIAAS